MGNAASMLLTYGATIDLKTVEKICLESESENFENANKIYAMVGDQKSGTFFNMQLHVAAS
jgi:hypothetical protein